MSEMFVVAHISDLHFNGSEHHRSRVESVLHYINSRARASTRCSSPATSSTAGRQPSTTRRSGRFWSVADGHHHRQSRRPRTLQRPVPPRSQPGARQFVAHRERGAVAARRLIDPQPGGRLHRRRRPRLARRSVARRRTRYPGAGRIPSSAGDRAHVVWTRSGRPARSDSPNSSTATRISSRSCAATSIPPPSPLSRVAPCASPPVSPPPSTCRSGIRCPQRGQPPGIAFHLIGDNRIVTHFRAVMD